MEEFKGDKRSKAYKAWKKNQEKAKENLKLGDKVAKFTETTGIKKVVKFVFGEDCGCEERQEKLNLAILNTFGKKHSRNLTEEEYNYVKDLIASPVITHEQRVRGKEIYENVFNTRLNSSCLKCSFTSRILKPLKKLVNLYDN